jgi:hypothetical protein
MNQYNNIFNHINLAIVLSIRDMEFNFDSDIRDQLTLTKEQVIVSNLPVDICIRLREVFSSHVSDCDKIVLKLSPTKNIQEMMVESSILLVKKIVSEVFPHIIDFSFEFSVNPISNKTFKKADQKDLSARISRNIGSIINNRIVSFLDEKSLIT